MNAEHHAVAPSVREIREHLDVVCASRTLIRSRRGQELLRHLVNAVLDGRPPGDLKGSVIGVEIFGLAPDHDTKANPIVRVAMGELRKALERYYEMEGRLQPLRIDIQHGSYRPDIIYAPAAATLALDDRSAMHVADALTQMYRRTLPAYDAALGHLTQALARHPDNPRLLSLKAMAHAGRANFGGYPWVELEEARTLIEHARQHEHEPWERPLTDAWLTMNVDLDWASAERLFERAHQLSQHKTLHSTWYTAYLASQLRWDEHVRLVQEVVTDGQDSPFARADLAAAYLMVGRLDAADHTLRSAFELFSVGHYMLHVERALLHELRGDIAGALSALDRLTGKARDTMVVAGLQPLFHGLAGDRRRARALYESLVQLRDSGTSYVPAVQLGAACMGTGDLDRATEWFAQGALREHYPLLCLMAVMPVMRHIHGHSGFRSLIEDKLKLRFP